MSIAMCPGSFDPITNGHIDVIERASKIFDSVVVVVMINYRKKGSYVFSDEERVELIKKATKNLPNVTVDTYDGLLVDYAKSHSINVVVKGLRAASDFEYEFQQALGNRQMNPELETVFIPTKAENMFVSSSIVRQIGEMGGDISSFVPSEVLTDLENKFRKD